MRYGVDGVGGTDGDRGATFPGPVAARSGFGERARGFLCGGCDRGRGTIRHGGTCIRRVGRNPPAAAGDAAAGTGIGCGLPGLRRKRPALDPVRGRGLRGLNRACRLGAAVGGKRIIVSNVSIPRCSPQPQARVPMRRRRPNRSATPGQCWPSVHTLIRSTGG